MNDLNEVKKKAGVLKENIQSLLTTFRNETGYTPEVKIDTHLRPTNGGNKVSQVVSINLTVT